MGKIFIKIRSPKAKIMAIISIQEEEYQSLFSYLLLYLILNYKLLANRDIKTQQFYTNFRYN